MRCPRCGSENISSIINTNTHTKGFDVVSIFFGVSTFLVIFSLLFPLTVTLRI